MFSSIFHSLWGTFGPYLQDIFVTALIPSFFAWLITWLKKIGVNVDDSRRDSLTKSAQRVAGELFTEVAAGHISLQELFEASADGTMVPNVSHPVIAQKIKDIVAAAPDAIKHFKLEGKDMPIAKKLLGEFGKLLAAAGPGGAVIGGVIGNIANK